MLIGHCGVSGVALQQADFDWFAFGGFAHAGLLAQGFGRANAGTHTTQNVLIKNGFGGGLGMARLDFADEQRDVDRGGTSLHARGIITEITPV